MANNIIKVKRTTVSGRTPNTTASYATNSQYIAAGEFALNMADGILYTSDGANAIPVGANNANVNFYQLRASGAAGSAGQILVANSTGINWETIPTTNVLYVSKGGLDTNSGTINKPFLTIKAALAAATTGTNIFIQNGDYTENNPLTVPPDVSVIGNSLRGVNVIAQNATSDLFWLNNGSYIREITVRGYTSPAAAFAFPSTGAVTSTGSPILTRSPYILNCTSITTTGIGLRIDGLKAGGTKSIIAGLYTIINQNGIGVYITNQGYSQLVNIYTICCNVSVQTESGGFCSLNCSDTSFGNWGLIANGTSNSSTVTVTANSTGFSNTADTILVSAASSRYSVGDRVFYSVPTANTPIAPLSGNTYYYVSFSNSTALSLSATSGGANINLTDARTTNPGQSHSIKIAPGTGNSNGVNQTGNSFLIANLAFTPYINSTLQFSGDSTYYTVTGVTPMVSNNSTVDIMETILSPIANNTAAVFYQRSQITASGHTFEYCGSGVNLANATPFTGGISNNSTQVVSGNGGIVNYTSTDEFGNFNIGSSLIINGQTATINGDTFQRSLFGLMTPYILALEGN